MRWFKSQKDIDAEKIEQLLNGFNVTHKYISDDGKSVMVLDDENQILGYINFKYGSGELETMRYKEIESINFEINSEPEAGIFDLECMNIKETEEFIGFTKEHLRSAINSTELYYNIELNVQTVLREKDFFINFFPEGIRKPPVSKSNAQVGSSIRQYTEFADLLLNACLVAKRDK